MSGVKKLQELFGNSLDPEVLAAVLEMNGLFGFFDLLIK